MPFETYFLGFLTAAVASSVLTPLVRRIALVRGWVATPGGRNVHTTPTPRVGGIAMFLAFVGTLGGLIALVPEARSLAGEHANWMCGLIAGGALMFGVGLYDDLRKMRALHKLLTHLAVGALAWACGFRIDSVDLPLLPPISMGVFSLPITVFWIAGIINAVNLIDGLDGLAAGVVFFAAITNLVVAIISGSPLVAIWMSVLLGVVFGFLFFNFNPARIFMGDSGSYFLGFLLAVTSISGPFQKASFTVSVLAPLAALGVPIIDTLFAMVRRILERRPIFSPDRGHLHHRLLDMGITHRRAVLIIYAACVCLTTASIVVALGRSWEVGVALVAIIGVLGGLVRFAGFFEQMNQARRQRQRIRGRETEHLRRLIHQLRPQLETASDEDGVLDVLEWVRDRGGLSFIEIYRYTGDHEVTPGAPPVLVRRFPPDTTERTVDLVTARFPLGPDARARGDVKFAWSSELGDVSMQTDILLQLVVDAIAERLVEVGSPLVAKAAEDETPEPAVLRVAESAK
jgi:UDP-GlcNAc:undecaprenyl-phosphate GlcNAc-1-phosphate transferase